MAGAQSWREIGTRERWLIVRVHIMKGLVYHAHKFELIIKVCTVRSYQRVLSRGTMW